MLARPTSFLPTCRVADSGHRGPAPRRTARRRADIPPTDGGSCRRRSRVRAHGPACGSGSWWGSERTWAPPVRGKTEEGRKKKAPLLPSSAKRRSSFSKRRGRSLEDIPREVFVDGEFAELRVDVGGVDGQCLTEVGTLERGVLEESLHHRVQAAGADVLGAFVDLPAISAMRSMPSSVNATLRPSVASSASYWRVRAAEGSVRMRLKSSGVRALSSTRIGSRPWSSGISPKDATGERHRRQ